MFPIAFEVNAVVSRLIQDILRALHVPQRPLLLVIFGWIVFLVATLDPFSSIFSIPPFFTHLILTLLTAVGGVLIVYTSRLPQYHWQYSSLERKATIVVIVCSTIVFAWFTATSLLASTQSKNSSPNEYTFLIQSQDGKPISRAIVWTEIAGSPPIQDITDSTGRVYIPTNVIAANSRFVLTVEAIGYQTGYISIDTKEANSLRTVTLKPKL